MALNDPFTLDLFGSTSLSSGLGLGVTAFPAAGNPTTLTTASRRRHRPCPSARGCRFETGDRSRREFPSRRRPRARKELE